MTSIFEGMGCYFKIQND